MYTRACTQSLWRPPYKFIHELVHKVYGELEMIVKIYTQVTYDAWIIYEVEVDYTNNIA